MLARKAPELPGQPFVSGPVTAGELSGGVTRRHPSRPTCWGLPFPPVGSENRTANCSNHSRTVLIHRYDRRIGLRDISAHDVQPAPGSAKESGV